jgi:hypothetical protein
MKSLLTSVAKMFVAEFRNERCLQSEIKVTVNEFAVHFPHFMNCLLVYLFMIYTRGIDLPVLRHVRIGTITLDRDSLDEDHLII